MPLQLSNSSSNKSDSTGGSAQGGAFRLNLNPSLSFLSSGNLGMAGMIGIGIVALIGLIVIFRK